MLRRAALMLSAEMARGDVDVEVLHLDLADRIAPPGIGDG